MRRNRKPSSDKKTIANRKNSKNSTGPTSLIGKWRSSQNARRHGLYARSHLLLGENAQERAEHDHVIMSRLKPITACQEIVAWQIADVSWAITRGERFKASYINREILIDVMDRKFPPKNITFMDGDRPIRSAEERNEILASHKKPLRPTEQDLETTLHRLFGERHDLISKMEKISLQHQKFLSQLVTRFDRMQKEDRKERETANGGHREPRLCDEQDQGGQTPWGNQEPGEEDQSSNIVSPDNKGDDT